MLMWMVVIFCHPMLKAQITGEIVDASDGGPIPYASAIYKGNKKAVSSDGRASFPSNDTTGGG